jgi:hypothetical protein
VPVSVAWGVHAGVPAFSVAVGIGVEVTATEAVEVGASAAVVSPAATVKGVLALLLPETVVMV